MAIVHCTGFETQYPPSYTDRSTPSSTICRSPDGEYDSSGFVGTGSPATHSTSKFYTGAASLVCGVGEGAFITIPEWTPVSTTQSVTVSFRLYIWSMSASVSVNIYAFKMKAGDTYGTLANAFDLNLFTTGTSPNFVRNIRVRGGTSGSGASTIISPDTWYHVEIRFADTGSGNCTTQLIVDGKFIDESPVSGTFAISGETHREVHLIGPPGGSVGYVHFDDLVVDVTNGSTPSPIGMARVAYLRPTSDYAINDWTGGAGGTTNLYEAVNNTPPIGNENETDLTQIECAVKNSSFTSGGAHFTYESDPLDLGTVLARMVVARHAEDINTGTKTGVIGFHTASPGLLVDISKNITFGDDTGALSNTVPINWWWDRVISTYKVRPTTHLISIGKTDSTTRVGSCDVLGVYVAYLPSKFLPQNTYHRAIAPLLVR